MEIRTRRLRILPATSGTVDAERVDHERLAKLIGASVPPDWPPESLREAAPQFARLHAQHPDWTGWLAWYAVRIDQEPPVLCGSVGFKGPPDASGTVEIGYSVLPAQRGRGLATEMVRALVGWALAQPAVRCVCAETTQDNPASARVLQRAGFQPVAAETGLRFVRYPTHRALER